MEVRFCDEFEGGFGWTLDEIRQRTSHALAADGGVWIVDPVDAPGVDERIRALGEPRGVLQLLDRHNRDCGELAARLGVPHHRLPQRLPNTPFEFLPIVRRRVGREVALWWPDRRVLCCADAIGTAAYFRAPHDRLAVHPWLRLKPPRALAELDPSHILCGHGEGLHGDEAAPALREALATARRRLPAALGRAVVEIVRGAAAR